MSEKRPLTADEMDLAFALARGRDAGLVKEVPKGLPTRTIYLHETVAESIARDAFTFGCLIATATFGVWIGSSALQWFGIGMVFIRALRLNNKSCLSFADARAELDRIEAKTKMKRAAEA